MKRWHAVHISNLNIIDYYLQILILLITWVCVLGCIFAALWHCKAQVTNHASLWLSVKQSLNKLLHYFHLIMHIISLFPVSITLLGNLFEWKHCFSKNTPCFESRVICIFNTAGVWGNFYVSTSLKDLHLHRQMWNVEYLAFVTRERIATYITDVSSWLLAKVHAAIQLTCYFYCWSYLGSNLVIFSKLKSMNIQRTHKLHREAQQSIPALASVAWFPHPQEARFRTGSCTLGSFKR